MIKLPVALNALRAIEAVARLGALEPAAAELGVTMGAVSQQLRRAEARLGVTLFDRTAAGLRPTPELLAQMPALRRGFETLAEAANALAGRVDDILTLTAGNVFASRWLVHRLGRFTEANPDLEFRLVATGKIIDLNRGDIDCGIRYGRAIGRGCAPSGSAARAWYCPSWHPVSPPGCTGRRISPMYR